jgi:hypothetical protein
VDAGKEVLNLSPTRSSSRAMVQEIRCAKLIVPEGKNASEHAYRCHHPGKVKVGREWYCGQHNPEAVELRRRTARLAFLRRSRPSEHFPEEDADDAAKRLAGMVERAQAQESRGRPSAADWKAIKEQARKLRRELRRMPKD